MATNNRRKRPILRWWIDYGPVVSAFVAAGAIADPDHATLWLAAAAFCASLSGGHKPPPILRGKKATNEEAQGDK